MSGETATAPAGLPLVPRGEPEVRKARPYGKDASPTLAAEGAERTGIAGDTRGRTGTAEAPAGLREPAVLPPVAIEYIFIGHRRP